MADLNNQLEIAQKINQSLIERNKILENQTKLLTSQSRIASELKASLDNRPLEGSEQRFASIRDNLQRAAEEAAKLSSSQDLATDATKKLGAEVGGLPKLFTTAKVAGIGFGVGLYSGFKAALGNLAAMGKLIGSIGRGLWEVGKSILFIPFQILDGLIGIAGRGGGPNPIRLALEEIRKEFGNLATNEGKALKSTLKGLNLHMGNFADTGISLRRLYGRGREGIAAVLKDVTAVAKAMGSTFGLLMGEFKGKHIATILAFKKGLGLSDEHLAALGKRAVMAGKPLRTVLLETANLSLKLGKDFGISSKFISRDIGEMMKDFDNFGTLSQKELAQTSVFARKLGIEIKALTGLVGKFDNFEDAAKNSSMLAQSFGLNVDAMKLMRAQNPAERLDQLRKAFFAAGKSVENMTRQELKLLGSTTGLSSEQAKLAFSQENMGMNYDDIKKKATDAEKKQITQTQAMTRLAKAMERIFQGGSGGIKSFFDAFVKGFARGIRWSRPFRKMIRNLRRALRQTLHFGRRMGRHFIKMFPGIKDMINGLSKMFEPKNFKKMFKKLEKVFIQFFTDLKTGKKSGVETLLKSIKKTFMEFFGTMAGSRTLGLLKAGFRKLVGVIGDVFAQLIPVAMKGMTKVINTITDIIVNPPDLSKGTAKFKSTMTLFLAKSILSIRDNLPALLGALGRLWGVLWQKAKPFLVKAGKKVLAFIISRMLLTAALSAVKGVAVKLVAGVFFGFFKTVAGMAGRMLGGSAAVKGLGKSLSGGFTPATAAFGGFFAKLAGIRYRDLLKAGIIIGAMIPLLRYGIPVLATGLAETAKILAPISWDNLLKSLTALGATVGSIVLLASAIGNPASMTAMGMGALGLAAGAGFLLLIDQVLVKVLISTVEQIQKVGPGNIAKTMAALAVAFGSMSLVALAATPMIKLAIPATLGLVASALFLKALPPVVGWINEIAKDIRSESDGMKMAKTMMAAAVAFGGIAVMATASTLMIPLGALGVLGLGATWLFLKALPKVLDTAKNAFDLRRWNIGDPKTFSMKIKAMQAIFSTTTMLASTAVDLAKIDETNFSNGAKAGSTIKAAKDFVTTVMSEVKGLVVVMVQQIKNINPEDLKSAAALSGILGKISGIMRAVQPPKEFFDAIKTTKSTSGGVWGFIVGNSTETSIDKSSAIGILAQMAKFTKVMMAAISKSIPTSVNAIISAAKSLKGVNVDVKNKLSIVAKAVDIISGFSATLGRVQKSAKALETKGYYSYKKSDQKKFKESLRRFDSISTFIVDVLAEDIESIVNKFSGLKIPAGYDASLKSITGTMKVISAFSSTMSEMLALAPKDSKDELFTERINRMTGTVKRVVGLIVHPEFGLPKLLNSIVGAVQQLPEIGKVSKKMKTLKAVLGSIGTFLSVMKTGVPLTKKMSSTDGYSSFSTTVMSDVIANIGDSIPKMIKMFEGITIPKGMRKIRSKARMLKTVLSIFGPLRDFLQFYEEGKKNIISLSKKGEVNLATGVQQVVDDIKKLNELLESGIPQVTLKGTIKKFGKAMEIGTTTLELKHKPINVTVKLELTMDAKEITTEIQKIGNFTSTSPGP